MAVVENAKETPAAPLTALFTFSSPPDAVRPLSATDSSAPAMSRCLSCYAVNDLAASSNAFWAASRQTRSAAWGERFASAAKAQSRF